jgi:hypothetical protein
MTYFNNEQRSLTKTAVGGTDLLNSFFHYGPSRQFIAHFRPNVTPKIKNGIIHICISEVNFRFVTTIHSYVFLILDRGHKFTYGILFVLLATCQQITLIGSLKQLNLCQQWYALLFFDWNATKL